MRVGRVYLVGTGPGDPGLLTVRGLDVLRSAEVVVYDRLVNPVLLDLVPVEALRIYVGKLTEHHCLPQSDINAILVSHARRGHSVVRLKGGDPFIFGRGAEEADALAHAGIAFEVVPGVSAAVGVPAYAGIPLTHRKLSSSFAVVTGHEDPAKDMSGVDWSRLATAVDILVILMGVKNLPAIAEQLVAHGRSPDTPVALVRWGTTDAQETIVGRLAEIPRLAAHVGLRPPVLAVVGQVVTLRERLHWFEGLSSARDFDEREVDLARS